MHKNFLFNNLEELMNYSNNYKGSDPLVKASKYYCSEFK